MEENTENQKETTKFFFVSKKDDAAFEKEKEILREINSRKLIFNRWRGYFKFIGPAWLLSALTLGAATAGSAFNAGSYGYALLWVVPLGKFFGILCLAAIGYQVCFTGERPYKVFWKRLNPSLAIFWGFNVLLASVIWQFPQYALGTAVVKDMFLVANIKIPAWIIAPSFLILATYICWSYGTGRRKYIIRFERILKYLVWGLVLAIALVVFKTGINWGATFKGFFFFKIPHDINAIMIILALLGASIGVNTTFLYPYIMLARRWVKEHNGLKNFDLTLSMFIPSVIAPSLLLIAVANSGIVDVKDVIEVAHALEPLAGLLTARVILSIGILGMCVSTMILEMLICGFVLSEMFGFEPRGWKFRLTTSIANIGIIGAFMALPFWVPVWTSAFNLIMTPIAFICFFILQNRKDYLGENVNRGWKGYLWNLGMLIAIFINALGTAGYIVGKFF